jgi:prepilin-type N-terminal cleavage/methylation domain-containing protein
MSKIARIRIKIMFRPTGFRAFSLIELVVVISIISLLLGILMPALSRSRALTKQAVCQSRLRQWGLAFETYAASNSGYYPHIDGLDRANGNADNFGWVDMLPPLMGEKRWCDYPLWQKPTKGIYQCPAAKLGSSKPPYTYDYNPQRNGYFSYAMNSCLELDSSCLEPLNCPGGNNMPSFLNTAKICHPGRVILLFDQLLDPAKGYGGTKYNATAGKYCGSYPKAFSARHARPGGLLGGSILYCDYHVEWVESVWNKNWPEEMKDNTSQAPPRNDVNWYPY